MQVAPVNVPHSLPELAPYLLAIIIAIPGWLVAWKGRKKTDADIDLTDAQAQKDRAESRKIEAEVTKTYNDTIREINEDLRKAIKERNELEVQLLDMRVERDEFKAQFELEQDRRAILEKQQDDFRHGGNGKVK